jgi:hypothetical protein
MTRLLLDAAKCFDELSSPFAAEWLADHDVTLDECGDLSELIASAVKLYVALPDDERFAMEVKRIINESDMPDDSKREMNAQVDFRQSLKRVQKAIGPK